MLDRFSQADFWLISTGLLVKLIIFHIMPQPVCLGTTTTHLSRHTFATTIRPTKGVPLESVSKMLGHKDLRTTQHYAKIVDRKISDDMKALQMKLALKEKKKTPNIKKR